MSSTVTVSAPGKIIISGEHTVVHGYPALVAAVDKRINITIAKSTSFEVSPGTSEVFVKDALEILNKNLGHLSKNLNISLESGIPIGQGMGSSAAFAVAFSAALLNYMWNKTDLTNINKLAYELEKKYHGKPSGVDISISTFGGIQWYRKETEEFKTFSQVDIKNNIQDIYVLNTGKPEETTKETIAHVSELLEKHPTLTIKIFKRIEEVTKSFLQFLLAEKDFDFSELIKTNERLLEKLGVVSKSTIELIKQIEKIGGAAKMSGGGGIKGASGIILVCHPDKDKLQSFMERKNLKIEKVKLGAKGVQIEKQN